MPHKQEGRTTPGTPQHIRRIWRAIAAVGLCLTMLLGGVGGSLALWNDAVTTDAGTIRAGTTGATAAVTSSMTHTYRDAQRVTTSSVDVANTGDVTAQFETRVTLQAGSSAPLANAIQVSTWAVRNVADCTAAAEAPPSSTTLAALTSTALGPVQLDAGASYGYCLRTTMDVSQATGIPSGATVTPVFTTTATVGATWTATAAANATQTFLDDIAPTTPAGLSSTKLSNTSTRLNWTASSDNVGVTRYQVSRDGTSTIIGTPTTPSFTDTTIVAGTSHTYQVRARDAVGNWSQWSPAIKVAGADLTPPSQPQNVKATATSGGNVTITFTASTDNIAVTAYTIYRNGQTQPLATVTAPGTTYSDPTVQQLSTYTYTVTAHDAAGNVSPMSSSATVYTPPSVGSILTIKAAGTTNCLTWKLRGHGGVHSLEMGTCGTGALFGWTFAGVATGAGQPQDYNIVSKYSDPTINAADWYALEQNGNYKVLGTGGSQFIWNVTSTTAGIYQLQTKSDKKCLQTNGSSITTATCNGSTSQQFILTPYTP